MADQTGTTRHGRDGRAEGADGDGRRPKMSSVVAQARRDFQGLLGHPVERVTSVAPDGDGWRLSVDVVELERIPDSTSVLGCYEIVVDEDGEIVEYERTRRFYRNRADEGDL